MTLWMEKLLGAAKAAQPADFSDARRDFEAGAGDEPRLEAEALRQVILGLHSPANPSGFDPGGCFRWKIIGLTIEGYLDLCDGRLPSCCSLAALEFAGCIFTGGFGADDAHLERLHFSDCAFGTPGDGSGEHSQISLRNALIDGELRLINLRPITAGGLLRVDASGVRVGANVILHDLALKAPPNQEVVDPLKTPYALNLRNAEIRADLFLQPAVSISGGVMLIGAHIGGDLRADGLTASDGADEAFRTAVRAKKGWLRYALNLQSVRVGGNLLAGANAQGNGVDIGGVADLSGIKVEGIIDAGGISVDAGSDAEIALDLRGADIKTFSCLTFTKQDGAEIAPVIRGALVFTGSEIGGSLFIQGAIPNLQAIGISVKGNVWLSTLLKRKKEANELSSDGSSGDAYAIVDLTAAAIKGSLTCISQYTNSPGDEPEEQASKPDGLTRLDGCSVGGDIFFDGTFRLLQARNLAAGGDTTLSILAQERVDLSGANLNANLRLSNFRFTRPRGPVGVRPALLLVDADIKGAITLGRDYLSDRQIIFSQARMSSPACYPSLRLIEVAASRSAKEVEAKQVEWTSFLLRKERDASVLDGGSSIFHLLNGKGALHLTSDREKVDYLRLFCAYVWGDAGPFKIIENVSQVSTLAPDSPPVPPLHSPLLSPARDQTGKTKRHITQAQAYIRYSNSLINARFEIAQDGKVEMVNDERVCALDRGELPKYESSFRFGPHAEQSDYLAESWRPLDERELKALIPNWRPPFRQKTVAFENALVDLTDASCGTLDDADGTAWGPDVTLRLENFTYSRLAASSDVTEETLSWTWELGAYVSRFVWTSLHAVGRKLWSVSGFLRYGFGLPKQNLPSLKTELEGGIPPWFSNLIDSGIRRTGAQDRLRWLERREFQNPLAESKNRVLYENFLPQPYAHLTKVFRDQGDDGAANEIEEQRIRIEHWLSAKHSLTGKLFLPFFGLFRIGFRYGLSPIRATCTFILFLFLGWAAVAFANHHDLLTQSTSTAATVVVKTPTGEASAAVPYSDAPAKSNFPCGNAISEPLYAVDVFIPLLDLRQEGRCDVRSTLESDAGPLQAYRSNGGWIGSRIGSAFWAGIVHPTVWQWLKAIYAIVGWVITSLTILTFSGTLRKWGQE